MPLWRRIASTISVALLELAGLGYGRARFEVQHVDSDGTVLSRGVAANLVTNVGRQFLHAQGYSASPATNGLNWFAVSPNAVDETATSIALSGELSSNGFTRKQATSISGPTGAGNQTVLKVEFSATGTQTVQKAALCSLSSGGTVSHILAFPQGSVTLVAGQKLIIFVTITLG